MNTLTTAGPDCECLQCIAKSGVLPQIVHNVLDGIYSEVTICESMSSRTAEAHGMPKNLTLLRFRADGSQRRMQYVQVEVLKQNRPDPTRDRPGFVTELTELINRYSKENASGTPDFVLATYLDQSLQVLENAIITRRTWYGTDKTAAAQTNV